MIESIKRLIELAGEDEQIRKLEARHASIPAKLQEMEQKSETLRQELTENEQRLQECRTRKSQLEKEVEEIRSNISKSNSKRSKIKTNREYWAMMKEVEDLKVLLKTKEDEIIAAMEELEGIEKTCDSLRHNIESVLKESEGEAQQLKGELKEAETDLERHRTVRLDIVAPIDEDLLYQYNRLLKVRGGEAIAGVRDGVCMACNMMIPPQQYNELQRSDRLMKCPHCQRIIYWLDHKELQDYIPQQFVRAEEE